MIKAVIFDVDGTLVDSVDAHAQAWVEVLAQFGYSVELTKVRQQIGKGGDQLLKEFLSNEELERDEDALQEARKKHFATFYLDGVKGFPKVPELFRRILADGRQIALASSAAGEELEPYKEKAGITDLVEKQTSKDDAEKSKPHPDIFQAALGKLENVAAEEVIIIGDAPWDAIAAGKAGLRTIGFLSGGFSETELREAGCEEIYAGAADLLEKYETSALGGK